MAVLVNRQAQGVSDRHVDELRRLVGDRLYVTASIDAGAQALRAIVERGDEALAIGGGDGTFTQVVADLLTIAPDRVPVLMPLRLGTGNAIADVSGSSRSIAGLASDLARAASDEPPRALSLLEVDGRPTHFTGVGLDADYATDFRWMVKDRKLGGIVGRMARGAPGLVVTAMTMTVPKLLVRPLRRIRISSLDEPAWRLSDRGERTTELAPGATLYEGPFSIAAASTIHSYSNGMTFFPFAESLDGAFHVRVSALTGFETLRALPRSFDGTYRHPKVHDFAARAVAFELAEPAPFHVGGDLQAPATRFSVRLAARTVPLLFRS